MHQILLHLGYILMLIALVVRDILWLRSILISAQVSLFCYALIQGHSLVAFWNFVFVGINVFQVVRIVHERKPIEVNPEFVDLYKSTFHSMTPREFVYFWDLGQIKEAGADVLIRQGEHQDELLLLLSGSVGVTQSGKLIAQLSKGNVMSEMSFITGEPASASIRSPGYIQYVAWSRAKLNDLKKLNPQLSIKLQGILGRDLINKIQSTTSY